MVRQSSTAIPRTICDNADILVKEYLAPCVAVLSWAILKRHLCLSVNNKSRHVQHASSRPLLFLLPASNTGQEVLRTRKKLDGNCSAGLRLQRWGFQYLEGQWTCSRAQVAWTSQHVASFRYRTLPLWSFAKQPKFAPRPCLSWSPHHCLVECCCPLP